MLKFINRSKKLAMLFLCASGLSLLSVTPARAQEGLMEVYLYKIMQYTYNIQQSAYTMLLSLNSWIIPDTSTTTSDLQERFAKLTNASLANNATQTSMQPQLLKDYFGPISPSTVPYVNDMSYPTLLGQLYFNPDPRQNAQNKVNPAYNYIKNAAGLNLSHAIPSPNWRGSTDNKQRYLNFYNTISAIQTYDGYLLSQLYADYVNGNQFTQLQNDLMQKASNSDWFAQISSENPGFVLRQMLMYNTQMYVLLAQLLQTQKQMLAAQAMTNTLIVLGNQFNEANLLNKATGNTP